MIETSGDFRAAIQLCGLVVEAAQAGDHPAIGATLARLRELLTFPTGTQPVPPRDAPESDGP